MVLLSKICNPLFIRGWERKFQQNGDGVNGGDGGGSGSEGVTIDFCVDSMSLATSSEKCNVIMP